MLSVNQKTGFVETKVFPKTSFILMNFFTEKKDYYKPNIEFEKETFTEMWKKTTHVEGGEQRNRIIEKF